MGIRLYVAAVALAGTAFVADRSDDLFGIPFTAVVAKLSPYAPLIEAHPPRPETREPPSRQADRRPVRAETVRMASSEEEDDQAPGRAEAAPPRRPCWSRAELSGSPREEKAIKGVDARRVPPREEALPPALTLDDSMRGVIRRVELPDTAKLVALTFNLNDQADEIGGYDGPVVDYLRREQVRATFFLGGKWIITHNLRARQLMADPLFEIGNNSWVRRDLRKQDPEPLQNEVEDAERAYQKLRRDYYGMSCTAALEGGGFPAPATRMTLFRFPEGVCNARALGAVNDAGLTVIQWDISAGDAGRGQSGQKIVGLVKPRVRPGSIVQFHADGSGLNTDEALHVLIPWLKAEGYRFVTVSELMRQPGAQLKTSADCSHRAEKPGRLRRRGNAD
jgi:peptidoglycan-N-acetylglucosamine deacetylase